MQAENKRIAVNIITGFLGVGKTTTINYLLKNKPQSQKWAVLVNEFGEVAIDNHVLSEFEDDEINIKEVSGGCMCCVGKVLFDVSLARIISEVKPDRILIEPSGLGHVRDLIQTMERKPFSARLMVNSPVCLVNIDLLSDRIVEKSIVFQDQIKQSQVLIANKAEKASPEQIDFFYNWGKERGFLEDEMFVVSNGQLDLSLLNRVFLYKKEKEALDFKTVQLDQTKEAENNLPNLPFNYPEVLVNQNDEFIGCGINYSKGEKFDHDKLLLWLEGIKGEDLYRFKAVLNTGKGTLLYQYAKQDDHFTYEYAIEVKNSVLEFIFYKELKDDKFKSILEGINGCLINKLIND